MTTEQTNMLVLKDSAGHYVVLSQETLELGRVPEEYGAELERVIAAAQRGAVGEDTQGHVAQAVAIGVAAFAVFYWGASMSYSIVKKYDQPLGPTIDRAVAQFKRQLDS